MAVVNVKSLHLRSGPGTVYPALGVLKYRQELRVLGRDEGGSWFKVLTEDEEEGWVAAQYVEFLGLLESIPVLEAPPTPVPTPTPTPTPAFEGQLVFQLSSGGDIYVVDLSNRSLRKLTTGMDPAWSPDGRWVAFARWEGEAKGIWVIRADGTDERPVFIYPHAKAPTWSPGGNRIAFTRQYGGRLHEETRCFFGRCFTLGPDPHWKLAIIEIDTGQFSDLPCDDHSFSPAWSPDGRFIAYDGDKGINLVAVDGSSHQALTTDPRDAYPVWSPDGTRIAFMHHQHDHWEIYIMNADGSGRMPLTMPTPLEEPANNVAPAWSPDGKHIAFLTDRNGRWEVYVMNADGSQQRPLLPEVLDSVEFHYDFVNEHVLDWIAP